MDLINERKLAARAKVLGESALASAWPELVELAHSEGRQGTDRLLSRARAGLRLALWWCERVDAVWAERRVFCASVGLILPR